MRRRKDEGSAGRETEWTRSPERNRGVGDEEGGSTNNEEGEECGDTRSGWDEGRRFAGYSEEGMKSPLRRRAEAKVGRTRKVGIEEITRRVGNEGTQGVETKKVEIEGTRDEEWRDACDR